MEAFMTDPIILTLTYPTDEHDGSLLIRRGEFAHLAPFDPNTQPVGDAIAAAKAQLLALESAPPELPAVETPKPKAKPKTKAKAKPRTPSLFDVPDDDPQPTLAAGANVTWAEDVTDTDGDPVRFTHGCIVEIDGQAAWVESPDGNDDLWLSLNDLTPTE